MHDYALVLNAGSSSLKFCVYARPQANDWHLESRGQIEGIGASPRILARDADGKTLIDQPPSTPVHDGAGALRARRTDPPSGCRPETEPLETR